jgi:UDP-glucose 4-epimerase
MASKRVLVTGGAGFIGSVVAEVMLDRGYAVVCVDNLVAGHTAAVDPRAEFVQANLLDRSRIFSIFEQYSFDAVLHLGAETLVGKSVEQPGLFFDVNVTGGLNVLDAMLAHGCHDLVFSSTAAVYGEPTTMPITEKTPKAPVNPYGESKLAFERMLPWFPQLRHVSFRYFNACGATLAHGEDRPVETHLVPVALEAADGRRAGLSLFGTDWDTPDGTCIRDYVHVCDIANAHILGLEQLEKCSGKAYNLGTGNGFSNRQVLEAVRKVTGVNFPITDAPRRAGDPERLIADGSLAQAELGWTPDFTEIEPMVETAWSWRKAHPNGYGR